MTSSSLPKGATLWLPVVIGNIVPLIGVLFFGWSLGNVIILYWIENLIIGFWNIPRILFAGKSKKASNIPLSLFFIVHYGIFCLVHGFFIMGLINFSRGDMHDPITSPFDFLTGAGLILGTLIMFLSIGWDFYTSYIRSGDFKNWDQGKAMMYPYSHIIVIHIAILFTAFFTILVGSPMILLISLIVGKTFIEIKSRNKKLTSS